MEQQHRGEPFPADSSGRPRTPPPDDPSSQGDLRAANQALQKRIAERTAQLQTVVAELTCAEQRERHRLAQLLHDDLQKWLTVAGQNAERLQAQLSIAPDDPSLRQLGEMIDRSLASLHAFASQLSPPVLYKGTLREILEWLASWMWQHDEFAVQVDADPLADPQAEEVRVLLFHVVRELLGNVLAHAGTRNARVTLQRSGGDFLELTVSDKGKGFDPAVKLGQGRFGTGLSLVTFRQRMELLGGRMDIQSSPGLGTHIRLVAPVRLARVLPQMEVCAATAEPAVPLHGVAVPVAGPGPDESQASRIRILLADDHAVVRDGLGQLLQEEPDMDVVGKAANGLEAVDLALQVKPDVIVMDANMPLLSGVQAAKRILAEHPDAKIIALSMYSVADMDLAMRRAGACDYLTKDSAPEMLVATIRKHAAALAR